MEIENLNKHDLLIVRYNEKLFRAEVTDLWVGGYEDDSDPDKAYIRIGADLHGYQEDEFGDEHAIKDTSSVVCKVRLIDAKDLPCNYDWVPVGRAACQWNEKCYDDANWSEVLEKPYKWMDEAWCAGHDFECLRGTLKDVVDRALKEAQV